MGEHESLNMFRAAASCLLVLVLCTPAAGQNILGIDWGSASVKAATLKANEFSIVLNEASKRKSDAAIGFDGDERLFGNAAGDRRGRKPRSVFQQFHHLLGNSYEAPVVQHLRNNAAMPFTIEPEASRGGAAVLTEAGERFGPEELLGMSLHFLAQLTAVNNKADAPSQCVVAVPASFSEAARKAVITAGEIGGIKVLRVVSDTAALAVQYAKDRTWPADKKQVDNVLLVDIGAAFTRASVVEYSMQGGVPTATIKAVESDDLLGGLQIDLKLADLLADSFDKKHGLKVREDPRAYAKLLRQAEKVKRTLSANEDTIVSIAALMNDLDLQQKVSRSQLEALCGELAAKITAPITRVLKAAKLEKVDQALPFGGGWRFPMIRSAIEAVPGVGQLATFINTDDAVALGAAFMHANSSGTLRVRKIRLIDLTAVAPDKTSAKPLTQAAIQDARKRHLQMCDLEKTRKALEFAVSEFEAWIYGQKEKIEEDDEDSAAIQVISAEEKETLVQQLGEAEDWLYDTENLTPQLCQSKKASMAPAFAAISLRLTEFEARPPAVQKLRKAISSTHERVKSWPTVRPHIPASKLQELGKLADQTTQWMDQNEKALADAGLFADLPFTSADVNSKLAALQDMSAVLRLMKPPKDDM